MTCCHGSKYSMSLNSACIPLCSCQMCLYCVPPFSLVPLPLDARSLCKAAGSLKCLDLTVEENCISEALAEVFDHKPLEELKLFLKDAFEVSSACSPV